jgi:hypothetical protein
VLAAAIQAEADLIVTMNLKHFPAKTLATHGLEPIHPDAFVMRLLEIDSSLVLTAIRRQRAALSRPALSVAELLEVFERPAKSLQLPDHQRVSRSNELEGLLETIALNFCPTGNIGEEFLVT